MMTCIYILSEDPVSARPRRVWTTAEDEALRRAISEVGEEDFRRVAARVPNRSSKQCRERWFNNLAPQIKKNKLSKREWAIVLQAQKELGNRCLFPLLPNSFSLSNII